MKRTRRNKWIALVAGAAVFGLALTGCGGTTAETTTPAETEIETETTTPEETTTPKETTTKAPEYESIGKESKDAISFELTNKTGQNIKSFMVVSDAETTAEPENLLEEEDVFEKTETRIVYVPAAEESSEDTAAETQETADADEKVLTTNYEIHLILEDDTEVTLHSFPLEDIANGEIRIESEIAYLVYENLKGEKNISTLKAEQAIAEAAAAEPVYEEPVYEEPVYEEPVYEEPVYEEPVYEEPVYDEPAGNDDACVEDGLLY